MKEYLVDISVSIMAFIRPDCLEKQFEVIKQARPSRLFIISDGPRENVPTDLDKIIASRKVVETIDWECDVHRLYFDDNQGLYATSKYSMDCIFNLVDRCIFLEDDDIPAVSFFRFCAELLEKYKDDRRIGGIAGFNHLEEYKGPKTDYFFQSELPSWGWAYWKRSYEEYFDFSLDYINDNYILKQMKKSLSKTTYKNAVKCAKEGMISGHIPWFEFYMGVSKALQNALYIMPTKNLISNWGCGNDAIHSSAYKNLSKDEQKLFYSNTYELEFPLKHPKYVIKDTKFEKIAKRITGYGHPLIRFKRRISKGVKTLWYQGFKGLNVQLKRIKNNKYEK